MAGKSFSGNLRITPVNALGIAIAGAIGLLNTVKCELVTPAPENIDQISRKIGTDGELISRGQRKKATTLNVVINDLDDQRVLAYALNGVSVAYIQAANIIAKQSSATVTAEAVTAGALGTPVYLAHHHVSLVVVKDSTGTTTYTLGTDYSVDAVHGSITPLVGGTITASEALKVDYAAAATSAESVSAPATLGDWIPLANRHISGVVVKNSAESTTYAEGTDYVVDGRPGFLRILAGGAITASQALKVSYTAAAISGKTVRGSVVASTLLRIDVQLESIVDGSEGYFVCPIFQASASGNQDLFGNQMLTAGLSGAMFLPPDGSAAATETGGAPYLLSEITG